MTWAMTTSEFILTIALGMVSWTAAVAGLTLYLHNKFRSLEVAFYRGLGKHRKEIDRTLHQHSGRIQRLEILVTGSSLDRYTETDPDSDSY